ncbi:sigma-54-dependent Fis family transcriptional regulator [Ferrimonas sediminicola]|uniref:Sigma-54-dependent Fis family transcriptional regulator n=1 Tax=Ferrimonas sediminicola TaxID=2569538 RepID=A0A4V5NXZ9_9GAMM|nr:sigma-54 dependent transcriptional regulator [Ferrimonas sediminicola]TKB48282.1 sigma-54-dependent Fis family transcriptional regulator [Ferrimonas sediminicola]
MKSLTVLVVDDEVAIRQILSHVISKLKHRVLTAESAEEALQVMSHNAVDVVFTDVRMAGMTGIEMIEVAKSRGWKPYFVVMTSFASVSTAIESMKMGAFDYLMKPLKREDVEHRLKLITDMIGLRRENKALRQVAMLSSGSALPSQSEAMLTVDRMIDKVAVKECTVMINGESGTGKGVVAKMLHRGSPRSGGAFIPVNCAAIPENLLESELFGHVKGAFTGATSAKMGLFETASGGTLFLDEVGELPLALQAKLLHVLEEKMVRPVGGEKLRPVDVRIIAATNRNLQQMVAEGLFREDLYFRLNVFNITLPPLRERGEDILPLFRHFLESESRKQGVKLAPVVDSEVQQLLQRYRFPGNIRELENIAERALVMADDNLVRVEDLPQQLCVTRARSEGDLTLREQLKRFEEKVIRSTLSDTDGDRREAAKRLGIGLSSLYRKLEEYQ